MNLRLRQLANRNDFAPGYMIDLSLSILGSCALLSKTARSSVDIRSYGHIFHPPIAALLLVAPPLVSMVRASGLPISPSGRFQ